MLTLPLLSAFSRRIAYFLLALFVTSGAHAASTLEMWADLVSFRPDEASQSRLLNRSVAAGEESWHIQKIERARGDLVLEQTSMVVTKLPAVEEKVLTPQGLLAFLRSNLSLFIEGEGLKFGPVTAEDKQMWTNDNPLNSVIEFTPTQGADTRQSAWQVTDVKRDEWTLTSVQVGGKDTTRNPYSGNRRIGVQAALPLDGCIIYSNAAFRAYDAPTAEIEKTLAAQSALNWQRIFARVKVWVESHGGTVISGLTTQQSSLIPWGTVSKALHTPKVAWQDLDGTWRSKDAGKRFKIVFRGLEAPCDFIERNKDGEEVRMQVTPQIVHGEKDKQGQPVTTYVLERSNEDPEVLRFYKFSSTLANDIVNAHPKPSKLILRRKGEKLVGEWLGLAISRDAAGRLSELKNPGDQPGRLYDFTPEGP